MDVNFGRSVHCNRGLPSRRGLVMVDSMAARRAVVVVDDDDDDKDEEEQVDDTALEKARIGTRREEARMVNASAKGNKLIGLGSDQSCRMTKNDGGRIRLARRAGTNGVCC